MFTPLAQYAVQIIRDDRLAEAQAARNRRLAREARAAARDRTSASAAHPVQAPARVAPAAS
jgi:hypothetical protein